MVLEKSTIVLGVIGAGAMVLILVLMDCVLNALLDILTGKKYLKDLMLVLGN